MLRKVQLIRIFGTLMFSVQCSKPGKKFDHPLSQVAAAGFRLHMLQLSILGSPLFFISNISFIISSRRPDNQGRNVIELHKQ